MELGYRNVRVKGGLADSSSRCCSDSFRTSFSPLYKIVPYDSSSCSQP